MEPPSKRQKADRWSDEETRILISVYEAFMINKLFDGTVRDTEVYKRIVAELTKVGVTRTVVQVRNRLKVLKRKYKEAKDKLRVSGAGSSIHFPFFDEMDKVMGHRAVVNPPISVDIGFGNDKANMNQSIEIDLSFEELDSTLPFESEALDGDVQEVENSSNTSEHTTTTSDPKTVSKLPCSSKKGRKRKRKNQYEEALRNVMEDVTAKVLDFETKMEQKAEEKREAFREKLLKQQNDLMEMIKMSIGQ